MPNISANLYDGAFDVSYDCVGAIKCNFCLCEIMPPERYDSCTFRENGSCRNPEAQIAAMKSILRRLKKHEEDLCSERE